MGKKDKAKKKGGGADKTATKNDKKALLKHKKMLEKIGETDIIEVVAQLEANEKRRQQVTEEIVPHPSPRSNFSLLTHPDKDELILFGGEFFNGKSLTVFNELFFYNIDKRQWKKVMTPGGPGPRSSHQMVAVSNNGGELWVFGGEHSTPSGMQFYHYKDLWVYNLAQKIWTKVEVTGGPSPRSGHRMIALKKRLYIFGGFYDTGISYKYFNDVWCFSLETYKWHEIKPSGMIKPVPRSAGCMAATPDGKILVWGGYSKSVIKKDVDRGTTHSDMFALVPEPNDANGLLWKWIPLKPKGSRPAPRSGVSIATTANGNSAFAFGGVVDVEEDEEVLEGHFSNDLLMFDLLNQKWWPVSLKKKSETKTERLDEEELQKSGKSDTTTLGAFTMTVGNSSKNTPSEPNSSQVDNTRSPNTSQPSPRMKPGMAICKGILYLFGGQVEQKNRQFTITDLYSLDVHKLDEWKTIIKQPETAHEWLESDDSGSDSDSDSDDSSMSDEDEEESEPDSDMETS